MDRDDVHGRSEHALEECGVVERGEFSREGNDEHRIDPRSGKRPQAPGRTEQLEGRPRAHDAVGVGVEGHRDAGDASGPGVIDGFGYEPGVPDMESVEGADRDAAGAEPASGHIVQPDADGGAVPAAGSRRAGARAPPS